jgi:DNA repair exonuclease SbcCD nuclease subunit
MKLLLYADLQATDGNEVCYHDPTIRLQDWRVRRFFEVLREIYDANHCEGLIDLGDTTDDRSAIPVPTIDALLTGLHNMGAWNVKLIGNHEQYTRDARVHVGKLFEHRFTVVEGVTAMQSPDSDAIFVFASFPGNYTALVDDLAKVAQDFKGRPLVLFGHFQVVGCKLNSGVALDGLPKESLLPFKLGFLGHVHKPQEVARNIYYVGSPFQQNFGESGEAKRVAILDTQSLHVEWITMEGLGFPVYRTVSASEFVECADETSEDRYHVVLSSQDDTETLFAHPLCNRAETEYSYTTNNSLQAAPVKSWSFESVLARYLAKNSPKGVGIDVPDDEMLAIGMEISQGAN